MALRVIDACWIVFAAVWILAALNTKRTAYKQSLGQRLIWVGTTAAGAALLSISARAFPRVWNESIDVAAPILCLFGLAFTLWARATLGRNWSGRVTIKEDHELIERGPYRLVRHPIYSGMSLMLIATALSIGNLGAFAGLFLILAGFGIKMAQEERMLMQRFPDEYAAYRKRTKRIVPFVV